MRSYCIATSWRSTASIPGDVPGPSSSTVTSLTQTDVSGPREDFGSAMAINDDRAAATVIRFWIAQGLKKKFRPGTYRVEVAAVLAKNAKVSAPTVSIEVTLL